MLQRARGRGTRGEAAPPPASPAPRRAVHSVHVNVFVLIQFLPIVIYIIILLKYLTISINTNNIKENIEHNYYYITYKPYHSTLT